MGGPVLAGQDEAGWFPWSLEVINGIPRPLAMGSFWRIDVIVLPFTCLLVEQPLWASPADEGPAGPSGGWASGRGLARTQASEPRVPILGELSPALGRQHRCGWGVVSYVAQYLRKSRRSHYAPTAARIAMKGHLLDTGRDSKQVP